MNKKTQLLLAILPGGLVVLGAYHLIKLLRHKF